MWMLQYVCASICMLQELHMPNCRSIQMLLYPVQMDFCSEMTRFGCYRNYSVVHSTKVYCFIHKSMSWGKTAGNRHSVAIATVFVEFLSRLAQEHFSIACPVCTCAGLLNPFHVTFVMEYTSQHYLMKYRVRRSLM